MEDCVSRGDTTQITRRITILTLVSLFVTKNGNSPQLHTKIFHLRSFPIHLRLLTPIHCVMFILEAFAHVAEGGAGGLRCVSVESIFGVGEEAQDHVFVFPMKIGLEDR